MPRPSRRADRGVLITAVRRASPAARAGIPARGRLLAMNRRPVRDALDYLWLRTGENLTLTVRAPGGETRDYRLAKPLDADPGLELEAIRPRLCRNRCVFCFMHQNPPGVRPALQLKDEDFRLSFLYGNYLTLTDLTAGDWRRIVRQRLSPLYVSVHATDERVRRRMLGRTRVPPILGLLRRLRLARLAAHIQVVLCPGYNDGAVLARTIADLERLHPAVQSVALVPVGLTKHRRGLVPLRPFTRSEAAALIDEYRPRQAGYRARFGCGWLYLADELFLRAGRAIPPADYYDDAPQLENGVGLARRLLDRLPRLQLRGARPWRIVTGADAARLLRPWAKRARVTVVPVRNRWLGPTVTVAGLLAGRDLLPVVRRSRRGTVFIPAAAVNDDGVFLDDLPLRELERQTGARVRRVAADGRIVA